ADREQGTDVAEVAPHRSRPGADDLESDPQPLLDERNVVRGDAAVEALVVEELDRTVVRVGTQQDHRVRGDPRLLLRGEHRGRGRRSDARDRAASGERGGGEAQRGEETGGPARNTSGDQTRRSPAGEERSAVTVTRQRPIRSLPATGPYPGGAHACRTKR